ncbi:hypothetical protein A0H76_305 [Hepatospora eriocheir]|uniref:Plus3 domain-containing protein n=1 Tax=Hepatospora eriocheir TaxID=1081669 RepID=A0A1X0QJ62_9MICR|nr:hypothetical protein A0H76_305 [Hepatospora eriocheir]
MKRRDHENEYVYDSDDKKYLNSLSNLEREKELSRRAERRQKALEMEKLKKLNAENHIPESEKEAPTGPKYQCIVPKKEFVLKRSDLIEHAFIPSFHLIKGAYVKLRVGDVYNICKIVKIGTIKKYKVEINERMRFIDRALNLEGEKFYKDVPLINLSERPTSSQEFEDFICKNKVSQEKFNQIEKKYTLIKREFDRSPTEAEITQTIKNREKLNPRKKTNTEIKIEIVRNREAAYARKDIKQAQMYQLKLEEIEDKEAYDRIVDVFPADQVEKRWEERQSYMKGITFKDDSIRIKRAMTSFRNKNSVKEEEEEEKPKLKSLPARVKNSSIKRPYKKHYTAQEIEKEIDELVSKIDDLKKKKV